MDDFRLFCKYNLINNEGTEKNAEMINNLKHRNIDTLKKDDIIEFLRLYYSNKSKTSFSLNSNVSLKDILISNSSSRKVVKE